MIESLSINLKRNLSISKDILGFNMQSINFITRTADLQNKSIEEFKNSYKQNII